MRSLERRIGELETTYRQRNTDEEPPPEILEMLRRIERDAEGIVLSEEGQKVNNQYIVDLFAQMRAAGEIK